MAQTTATQELTINNGQFTSNGNFTGYTAKGKRVHIYKRQMESLGVKYDDANKPAEDTNLKAMLPFYCLAEEKTYSNRLGADGKPVVGPDGETGFTRLTALSVFESVDAIATAEAEELTLKGQIQNIVREKASNVGLSESQIDALLAVSI